MKLVLDTGILMLILKGDPRVRDLLYEDRNKYYTLMLNLIELYYKTEEKLGRETALTWFNRVLGVDDINIVSIDKRLALEAGRIKARYRYLLSIVDATIIALAKILKATLLTTDNRLAETKEVKVKIYRV